MKTFLSLIRKANFFLTLALLTAGIALICPPALCQPPAAKGKLIALCIGVDRYPNLKNADLTSCVEDARHMAMFFRRQTGELYTQAEVVFCKDEDATLANLRQRFADIAEKASPNDTIVIYFAGHASINSRGEGVFLPYDAADGDEKDDLAEQELRKIAEMLAGKANRVLFILDAEYSTKWASAPLPSNITIIGIAANSIANEKAFGDQKRGVFTYYLEKILLDDRLTGGIVRLQDIKNVVSPVLKATDHEEIVQIIPGNLKETFPLFTVITPPPTSLLWDSEPEIVVIDAR